MGVIVIGLGTPQSARENFGYTWKHWRQGWEHLGTPVTSLEAPATCLGVPATSLEVQETSLEVPATSLGAPRITVEWSGKNNIFFRNTAGAPENHSY